MYEKPVIKLDSLVDRRLARSSPNSSIGKSCPVCGKLDLDVVGKANGRRLEYYIEPSDQNHDLLFQWRRKCDLCKIVYDLDQHWSEHGDFNQELKFDGFKRFSACGRMNGPDTFPCILSADWGEFLSPRSRNWT